MHKIYIIKAGTTFQDVAEKYGDFDLWTLTSMGISESEAIVIDIQNGTSLPEPQKCMGVVITGSHVMVTDHIIKKDSTIPSSGYQ